MPDIEEMVLASMNLTELETKFQAYIKGEIVRGAVLPSNEYIEDVCISWGTALQVLQKRIEYHKPIKNMKEETNA